MKYVMIGDVRGECGHQHRTIFGAAKCAMRDQAACKRAGGYSDRKPEHLDGSQISDGDREIYILTINAKWSWR
jgi:hypothetical protein